MKFNGLQQFAARINTMLEKQPRGQAIKAMEEDDGLHLWAYGPIGGYWEGVDALAFNQAIQEYKGDSITVHVNSEGGDVFAGIAMYGALDAAKQEVTTINEGLAASAASVLMQAGDLRIMQPATKMMIHRAWTVSVGNAEDMRDVADILDSVDSELANLYAAASTIPHATIMDLLSAETWYSADQAVEDGLADRVGLEPETVENRSPYERLRAKVRLAGLTH
jgi:ATP-dependent protease ClpP protease subunit